VTTQPTGSTTSDIASQIVQALRVTDPDLDTSTGTTTRKIIDAVSESISEAYIDQHLLGYQYDIDSKIEADLDDFVQLFGMARILAKRASGTLVFTRATTATNNDVISIPVNTEVQNTSVPPVVVQTVTGGFLEPGATSVTVAAQAVEGGPSGNVAANTLTNISTPIQGVGVVNNINPFTGGTHQETDLELRDRWKKTVFRNLAGTEQMYLGVALDDVTCYAANVVGASKKRREQLQIVTGVAQTTVDDALYVYTEPVFVGPNIDGGDINIKDRDYSWNSTYTDPGTGALQPRVNVIDAAKMPDDSFIEVDFEYQPKASRNDPPNGITNRVDLWVGGSRAQAATQSLIFRSGVRFSSTPLPTPDPLSQFKFMRYDQSGPPTANNVFVPLAFGPVLVVPPTLSIGSQVYAQASAAHPMGTEETIGGENVKYAYLPVAQNDAFGYTTTSMFGIEWYSGTGFMPPNNTAFSIGGNETGNPYLYNAMINDIQEAVDRWRLLGVDAKVHQAKTIALRLNVALMYLPKANRPTVDAALDTALGDWFTTVGFQGRVQMSDLLQVMHNVEGVDNVRFLHGSDYPTYNPATPNVFAVGTQAMVNGVVIASYVDITGRPTDLRFGDDELPVFHSLYRAVKAENSFGVM
jgi:phage-related baseplate assembly protein